MRVLFALLGMLWISGCQATGSLPPPPPWWQVGLTEPAYMTVWVETVEAIDVKGQHFQRITSGRPASAAPEDGTESARGWRGIGGGGRAAVGADLPARIFVRWQSIVEPQTYRAWVDIPEEARQVMRVSGSKQCAEDPGLRPLGGGGGLILGLAPGGIVQVWVRDECYRRIKVARAQADIEPLGPDQGNNEGRYAYPVSEKSKRYIERFGIPYGSW